MKDFDIKSEVKKLPETPGVYLMHNAVDEIIYVGKAVNLKNRVSQYFHHNDKRQKRIQTMIANIQWFEIIQVETELEALILESNLIKKHRPRYNAALRKDENHPYLRIDLKSVYPAIAVTTENDRSDMFSGTLYIGPFYKAMEIETAVDWICKYEGLRTCSKSLDGALPEGHPCMYYDLQQCMAPCMGKTDKALYSNHLREALQFFKSQDDRQIREELQNRMQQAVEEMAFERAGSCKRMLMQLDEINKKLNFTSRENEENMDLFAMASDGKQAVILLYLIRGRRLSGRDIFTLNIEGTKLFRKDPVDGGTPYNADTGRHLTGSRILQIFIKRFYQECPYIPGKVLLAQRISGIKELENILAERKGASVICTCPRTGENGRFAQIAKQNAEELLKQQKAEV